MPAEEHVEPLIELPERGARRRSAGCACSDDRQAGRSRAGQIRSARGCNDGSAQIRRAKGRGHPADQRADFRHPQLPAAPTIRRSARAFRPAAHRRCSAWKRTRRNFRPLAATRSPRPAAVVRQPPRQPLRQQPARPPPQRRPTVIVLRPMRPREELFVLRSACGADVRSICGGVAPGGGRIIQCLATNAAQLSPACKDVLAQFAAQ